MLGRCLAKTILLSSVLAFYSAIHAADRKTNSPASSDPFSALKQTFANRAAVHLDEDFSHGAGNWKAVDGSSVEWRVDRLGFAVPGRLAFYQPSLKLTDYQLNFQGTIHSSALSWAVRASDPRNYYAVKLVVLQTRPLRKLAVRRYAVVNGVAMKTVETPLMLNERTDSLYRVSMTVQGDRFLLTIQDHIADSWTERRLKQGGVALFADHGEQSRITKLQITHHDDWIGRLCAQLAR